MLKERKTFKQLNERVMNIDKVSFITEMVFVELS